MASPINPAGGGDPTPADAVFDDFGLGVDGDGGADLGDSGGGDPSAIPDLEQVAADFEADILGESGQDSASPAPPSSPDALDDYIAHNYGGDKSAFVASLHESRNEGKRLAQEVAQLREKIEPVKSPKDAEAEFQAARDSSPVVSAIRQDLKAIESQVGVNDARQIEIAKIAGNLDREIKQLEGSISGNDDPSKVSSLQQALYMKRLDMIQLNNEFQTNDTARRQYVTAYQSLNRELVRAENDLKSELAYKEQSVRQQTEAKQRSVSDFNSSFSTLIRAYDVDPKSEKGRYLYRATREILAGHLEEQAAAGKAQGLDSYEIAEAVGKLLARTARALSIPRRTGSGRPAVGIRPSITPRQVVAPRRAVLPNAGDASNVDGPRAPRSQDEILSDPALVRKRANAIFEAEAKRSRQRGRGPLA